MYIVQAQIQEFTQRDARFFKGKILQKREKRETIYLNYIFKIRPDFNVFYKTFPDFILTFLTKRGKIGLLFLLRGMRRPPLRGSGGCDRVPASLLYQRLSMYMVYGKIV